MWFGGAEVNKNQDTTCVVRLIPKFLIPTNTSNLSYNDNYCFARSFLIRRNRWWILLQVCTPQSSSVSLSITRTLSNRPCHHKPANCFRKVSQLQGIRAARSQSRSPRPVTHLLPPSSTTWQPSTTAAQPRLRTARSAPPHPQSPQHAALPRRGAVWREAQAISDPLASAQRLTAD